MLPGTPCDFASDTGCTIYQNRPRHPCQTFSCAWLTRSDILPKHMKPSRCGAIVLLGRKWHGRDVIRAVPTGKKIPPATLEWLMSYSRKNGVPLLFSEFIFREGKFIAKKRIGYGPPDFVREVKTRIESEDISKS
jgi:hypothetical protein